jgi:hypothetical protein
VLAIDETIYVSVGESRRPEEPERIDGGIYRLNLDTFTLEARVPVPFHRSYYGRLATDGATLYTLSDTGCYRVEPEEQAVDVLWSGRTKNTQRPVSSGSWVVFATRDNELIQWNAADSECATLAEYGEDVWLRGGARGFVVVETRNRQDVIAIEKASDRAVRPAIEQVVRLDRRVPFSLFEAVDTTIIVREYDLPRPTQIVIDVMKQDYASVELGERLIELQPLPERASRLLLEAARRHCE